MIEWRIPQGSTYAENIDFLINLILVMTTFWFLLTAGMFFYLLWKYREQEGVKPGYVTGDEKDLKKWITWPHALIILCDIVIIIFAVHTWWLVKQNLPEPDATVRVIGQQWAWTFVHPGADGEIDTEDDIHMVDQLHVEVGKVYHYKLESRDVLHNFSVPTFRLKQDSIPGREITGWFEPTKEGEFMIQCAEICGMGHGIMGARLHVHSSEDYAAWVQSMAGER